MATYSKSPARQLIPGDTLIFSHKGRELQYEVSDRYLSYKVGSNDAIFNLLGIEDRRAFCRDYYGKSDASQGSHQFPECVPGDYAALTRVARALFARCKKPTKAEAGAIAAAEVLERKAAQEAARKAKAEGKRRAAHLKRLPAAARAAALALQSDPHGFGCQRHSVVKLVSALVGHDLSLVLE